MKKVLFEVLNKIEPYDILEISTSRDYHIELCRADSVFPLACNLERVSGYEDMYRREYDYALEASDFRLTPGGTSATANNNDSIRDFLAERRNNRNRYMEDHTIELNGLKLALEKALSILNPKGRIAVITFHSLEDKIVKEKFKSVCEGEKWNRYMPVTNEKQLVEFTLVNRKPILPSDEELSENRRSHSAKLRIIEKS